MIEEIETLSDEQIAEAIAYTSFSNLYYVYFETDGSIALISNEKDTTKVQNFIEVEYNRVSKFLEGKENYIDYKVSLVDKDTLSIVKKTQDAGTNTNFLILVDEVASEHTLMLIEWNQKDNCWNFSINPEHKSQLLEMGVSTKLLFFVSKESNANFLVRTIDIDLASLVQLDKLSVPFISKMEQDISSLSVSTRRFFDSYGLVINDQD
jgi:hypothetical protein